MQTIQFQLRGEEDFIPLMSLLKATNIVYSGAEAGEVIQQGMVTRNGMVETRKRAKIHSGETVCFGGYEIIVL